MAKAKERGLGAGRRGEFSTSWMIANQFAVGNLQFANANSLLQIENWRLRTGASHQTFDIRHLTYFMDC